jgi:hypothetical protein
MAGKKPNNFPVVSPLTGLEEIYTQKDDIIGKFTVDQVVQRANASTLTPMAYTFNNVTTFTVNHNIGRRPIVEVVKILGGFECEVDVDVKSTNNQTIMNSNTLISGKIYIT